MCLLQRVFSNSINTPGFPLSATRGGGWGEGIWEIVGLADIDPMAGWGTTAAHSLLTSSTAPASSAPVPGSLLPFRQ